MTSKQLELLKIEELKYKESIIKLIAEDNISLIKALERNHYANTQEVKTVIKHIKELPTYRAAAENLKGMLNYLKTEEINEYLRDILVEYTEILLEDKEVKEHIRQVAEEERERKLNNYILYGIEK